MFIEKININKCIFNTTKNQNHYNPHCYNY